MLKLRKQLGLYDLRAEGAKYVEKNFGKEFVGEFLDCYDTLNNGGTIGDFYETTIFLNLLDTIKEEI